MTQSKFKIGDKVMVTDEEDCWLYYDEMAALMGLTNWGEGTVPNKNSEVIIINIEQHLKRNELVIAIRTKDGKEHIMGEEALELLETSKSDIKQSDVIQISRDLLNKYYDVSTKGQKRYIIDNFKIDGTTTVNAIIELEKMACSDWKHVIRENHPECFPKPEFDFSEYREKIGTVILSKEDYKLLGFEVSPIQIRNFGEYKCKGFYLSNRVEWKLVEDHGAQVLVPIKKEIKH